MSFFIYNSVLSKHYIIWLNFYFSFVFFCKSFVIFVVQSFDDMFDIDDYVIMASKRMTASKKILAIKLTRRMYYPSVR